jgi:hypothetical protein
MLLYQGYACAGCNYIADPGKRALHVDHDHKTGAVRGLLCYHCNTAVKWMRDRAIVGYRLGQYLTDTPASSVFSMPRLAPAKKKHSKKKTAK